MISTIIEKSKVVHLISSMRLGGAQEVLSILIMQTSCKIDHEVYYLRGSNAYSNSNCREMAQAKKIGVYDFLRIGKRIIESGSRHRKLIVHAWMYQANLSAILLKLITKSPRVIISIHNASDRLGYVSFNGWVCSKLSAMLSGCATHTIFVSGSSMRLHSAYKGSCVIPNPSKFEITSSAAIQSKSTESSVSESNIIFFGHVGRFDKIKSYELLFGTFKFIRDSGFCFKLRMCGTGIDDKNQYLAKLIKFYGLSDFVELYGELDDMKAFYCGLDCIIVTSKAESFSNVLLESVSLGIPFFSTDVGIAKDVLNQYSFILTHSPLVNANIIVQNAKKISYIRNNGEYMNQIAGIRKNYSTDSIVNSYLDRWFGAC